ncbi:multidrug effflux MFS transporter [Vibrio sp. S4M6]|nr:multidrug effflux MFS transporter [Vibrio sinus]
MSLWLLGLAGVSFYLPAMPLLGSQLSASASLVKLTITFYIIGKAVSMFIYGPFVEAFGRKLYLVIGISLFTFGSALCAMANNIDWVLIGRLIQGIGCSLCILMGRAVINDQYPHRKAASLFSYIFTGNAILLMALPIIAGYIATYWGWRAIFYSFFVYGLVLTTLVISFIPETNPGASVKNLELKQIKHNYWQIIKNKSFWGVVLLIALMTAGEKVFTTSASYTFIDTLHYSKVNFGYLLSTLWFAHLAGVVLCGWLVIRLGIDRLMSFGSTLLFISALALGIASLLNISSGILLAGTMFLYMFGSGFIITTAAVAMVRPFPQLIGLATAIGMAVEFTLASIASFIVSHFSQHSIKPVMLSISTVGALVLITWFYLVRQSCSDPELIAQND